MLAGWSYPMSTEALVMAAVFDRSGALARLRGKFTYPRPWERDERQVKKFGNAAGRTPEQVMQILAQHGHPLRTEVA